MQWTGLNELREKYLSFFESKGHLRLDSWTEYNTTVSTTDGKVSNILRIWVP